MSISDFSRSVIVPVCSGLGAVCCNDGVTLREDVLCIIVRFDNVVEVDVVRIGGVGLVFFDGVFVSADGAVPRDVVGVVGEVSDRDIGIVIGISSMESESGNCGLSSGL